MATNKIPTLKEPRNYRNNKWTRASNSLDRNQIQRGLGIIISKIEVHPVRLEYSRPFTTALDTSEESHNIVVKITTDHGTIGWGEASPSPRITHETAETVLDALNKICPKLIGRNPLEVERLIEVIDRTVTDNTSAKASIDIAVHDLLGKNAKMPIHRLLGGYRRKVETDYTLGIRKTEETLVEAAEAVEAGFRILKVKVGIDPKEDVERIRRIRGAVGDEIRIRIDANQGWSVRRATETLRRLKRFDLEFVEQPVKANDIKGLSQVKRTSPIPVMADESVHTPEDAITVAKAEAVDLINIKLMKSGGIWKARKIAAIAEAANIPCMIGCMGESNIGITAAVQLATATKNIQFADLDSDLMLKQKLVKTGGAGYDDGFRIPQESTGLGNLKIDHEFLGRPFITFE